MRALRPARAGDEGLLEAFRSDPEVAAELGRLEGEVAGQKTTPAAAARQLLTIFRSERES